MSDNLQLGHHPDADQLSAFAENALPAHEREPLLLHLSTCADCREILALSLPPLEAPELVPAIPTPEPLKPLLSQWFTGWNLTLVGGLAFASIILVAVLHHRADIFTTPNQTARVEPAPPLSNPEVLAPPAPPAKQPAAIQRVAPSPSVLPAPKGMAIESFDKKATLDTSTMDGVIKNQSVENLPLNGRSYQAFPLRRPATPDMQDSANGSITAGRAMGQGAAIPQPAAKIPAPEPQNYVAAAPAAPAASSQTIEVSSNAAEMTTTNATLGAVLLPSSAPLPSHLATISTLTQGNRTLALDTAGTLFLSTDAGAHWKTVHTPWESHAVTLHLASTAHHNSMAFLATPPQAAPKLKANKLFPASITGTVTDASGAAIPGATITATGSSSTTARTDASGTYILSNLPPGAYHLQAFASGFSSADRTLDLPVTQPITINLTLSIASTTQTITVNGTAPLLNTEDAYAPREAKKRKAQEPVFAVETANGEHWVSSDGKHWSKIP